VSDAPDDLKHELPPLGSRCAAPNCAHVPTYIESLDFDYGWYVVHHELYFCRMHLEQHRGLRRQD
jgi:hypothetical protein